MGNCLGLLRRFIRQYSQQDDLCLRKGTSFNAKAARKFNFSRKDSPKNMPRYKNLSEFSARNSGNMREKNGGMSGKLSQQELPYQRHARTPCTETVPYYIPLICPLIHSLSSKTTLSHISIQNMSHSVYSHRKSQNRAFH